MMDGKATDGLTPVKSVGDGRRQVHLLGFMGVGKSTVGTHLARLLVWNFLDLDTLIVRHKGCSIAEIFAQEGEAEFRAAEAFALRQAVRKPHTVVALGGGTTVAAGNRAVSEAAAVGVWLDCPLEVVRRRIGAAAAAARPLWSDLGGLAALYAERRPYYAYAPLRIDASAAPELVAERILTALALET